MGRLLLLVAVAQLLQVITADNIPVSHAANTFAAELYQKLSKSPGNVLVCPLSVHIALSLLQQGAAGTSRDELGKALHLTGSNDNIKSEYKTLLEGLQDDVLKIATNIYPDKSFTPMPEFVKVAQEYFQSGVQTLDYGGAPVEAAKTINKYVEDKTNNKIHDIVKADSLNELTRMIIINAVHFKAEWEKTFPPAFPLNFKVTPTESIKTDFFTLTDYFPYKEDGALGAKILKMDYKGGKYSMVFVLPTKDDGLPEVEAKLANISMDSLLSGLNDLRVEVTIPKFKIEKQMELIEPLMEMGITNIFGANADLSNLAKEEKLYVSKIVQKTFIDVNEKGTEAAAATAIEIALLSAIEHYPPPEVFRADHPFVVFLVKAEPALTVFTGRLIKP